MTIKKLSCALWICFLQAREEQRSHIYAGNLALPTSQQPSPLFCFGQEVVDKHNLQLFAYINSLLNKQADFTQVIPNILYGITDELTLTAGTPTAAKFKYQNIRSSGIGDLFIQTEYAFYNKDRSTYAQQATCVAQMTFPSGSLKKNPPTGFGSPTFLIGATAGHMGINWYLFTCFGGIITTPHHNNQFPNTILYQWGIGRNIYYISEKLIITLLAEFFGSYTSTTRIRGPHYKNFDANNFYIGPSLWISTRHFIFNPGIAFSLYKQQANDPTRGRVLVSADIGWTFN